jgi:hypothetical protein
VQEQIEQAAELIVVVDELHTLEQPGLCRWRKWEQVRSHEQDLSRDSAHEQLTENRELLPQKKGSPWSALAPQKPATELLPPV